MGLLSTPLSASVRFAIDMAKEILNLRAQGRASEVTDEMMKYADPQYLFNNTPLPMDTANRLHRAEVGGFDTKVPLYHSADKEIESINPNFKASFGGEKGAFYTTTNPDVANTYDGNMMQQFYGKTPEDALIVDAHNRGFAELDKETVTSQGILGEVVPQQFDKWSAGNRSIGRPEVIHTDMVSAGYPSDTTVFNRVKDEGSYNRIDPEDEFYDGTPSTVRADQNATNLRSTSARFDPEFSHLSNTLASNPIATTAAGAGGLLAMTGSEDADAGVVGKSLDNIIKAANKQGVKLDVFENKKKGSLELSRIVVPEKSKGVGTSIMNDLAEYADKTGQTVSLSPSTDFGGTSKRRLTEFYKRFGFVQNKGRNKDYTISNSMYRSPSIKSSNPVATTSAGLLANVTGQPSNLSSYMQGNTDAYLTSAERQYLQNKQSFEGNFSDDTGWDRADILPFRVNEQTGDVEFATPEMIKGLLSGIYDIGQSKNTKINNPASLLELI